jgi:hypothetical protein
MIIDREVTIHAKDKKTGMTCGELVAALMNVPVDMTPQVVISVSGRIKTIRVKARVTLERTL